MGCNCGKQKPRYQVKSGGRIVFVTNTEATAQSVANRYKDGEVVTLLPTP